METPAKKKIPPSMVRAQGLRATKLFPKIPSTPSIRATMPPIVRINAKILIIIYLVLVDELKL